MGGRFTRDQKINNYALYAPYAVPPPIFVLNTSSSSLANEVFNLPSWKFELDYKPDSATLVYGSINRGAKGGGFNEPVTGPITSAGVLQFRPEYLTSYEVGEKWTFWDGKARLNADVFYYDYHDYQAFLLTGLSIFVNNFQAKNNGGELELSVLPVTGLELRIGVAAQNSLIENVPLPSGTIVANRVLPEAPRWSVNALARYEWQALDSRWWIQADSKTNTPMYWEAFNAPVDYEPGQTVVNARVGFTSGNGRLDVTAFCNNLADRFYRVYSNDNSTIGFDAQVYAPPRWYGVTLAYHFH